MKKTIKRKLTQAEIDRLVVVQVEDDGAWEKPVHVRRSKSASLSIPAELAARAAFLARVHHQPSIGRWVETIVRERVELEEAALRGAKRELVEKNPASLN